MFFLRFIQQECYYNTTISNSTLGESRQYICHLTKCTRPTLYCQDILHYHWRWGQKKDNATVHNTAEVDVPICLEASSFFPQLWLVYLSSHWPDLTFAPTPDAEITPSASRWAAAFLISCIYSSTERLQVRLEKQQQKYVRLTMPKAGAPQRAQWKPLSLALLITIALCLCYALLSLSGVIPALFLPLPSSQFINFPYSHNNVLDPAASGRFQWLLSTMAADEVLQMKPYTPSPDHSPSTATGLDMISSSILPILKSWAKGL